MQTPVNNHTKLVFNQLMDIQLVELVLYFHELNSSYDIT